MRLVIYPSRLGLLFTLVAGAGLLAACSYTNGYDTPSPCNLPAKVSYQTDVLPILTQNCLKACHNSASLQGGFNMEDFKQVYYYAQPANGLNNVPYLVGNIRHDSGFPAMPQGGAKLDDCSIATIEAWVAAGAPNN